jgi:hypothetical protein
VFPMGGTDREYGGSAEGVEKKGRRKYGKAAI